MKKVLINIALTAVTVALFGGPLFFWMWRNGI